MVRVEYLWKCYQKNGPSNLFECKETLKMGVNETVV